MNFKVFHTVFWGGGACQFSILAKDAWHAASLCGTKRGKPPHHSGSKKLQMRALAEIGTLVFSIPHSIKKGQTNTGSVKHENSPCMTLHSWKCWRSTIRPLTDIYAIKTCR